jgi:hypothetical protein
VSHVEDAEAAQAVDIFSAGDVAVRVEIRVGPLDDRARPVRVGGLTVLEESGVDVISKALDRLARDPLRLRRRNLGLLDQV